MCDGAEGGEVLWLLDHLTEEKKKEKEEESLSYLYVEDVVTLKRCTNSFTFVGIIRNVHQ